MSCLISKSWKNFQFRFLKSSDHLDVMSLLKRDYFSDEPTNALLTPEERELRIQSVGSRISKYLSTNMSFAAFDKNTLKIAGLALVQPHFLHQTSPPFDTPENRIHKYFIQLESQINAFKTFGIESYFDLSLISVDGSYRGQGLATELYRRGIELARTQGFPIITTSLTSPWTRRIGDHFGFKELINLSFNEAVGDDGKSLFPDSNSKGFGSFRILEV